MDHFGPEIVCIQSSAFLLKIFFNDLMIFSEKSFVLSKWTILGCNWLALVTLDAFQGFFLCQHNESGQEARKIYISRFCKQDLVDCEWVVVIPKMLCHQNSGPAQKDTFIIQHNEMGEEAFEN